MREKERKVSEYTEWVSEGWNLHWNAAVLLIGQIINAYTESLTGCNCGNVGTHNCRLMQFSPAFSLSLSLSFSLSYFLALSSILIEVATSHKWHSAVETLYTFPSLILAHMSYEYNNSLLATLLGWLRQLCSCLYDLKRNMQTCNDRIKCTTQCSLPSFPSWKRRLLNGIFPPS